MFDFSRKNRVCLVHLVVGKIRICCFRYASVRLYVSSGELQAHHQCFALLKGKRNFGSAFKVIRHALEFFLFPGCIGVVHHKESVRTVLILMGKNRDLRNRCIYTLRFLFCLLSSDSGCVSSDNLKRRIEVRSEIVTALWIKMVGGSNWLDQD